MLTDVKRYFLRGVTDWCAVPSYVKGLNRQTWVQLMISVDSLLFCLSEDFLTKVDVRWIHPRCLNQDGAETFFSMMTSHKTADQFESRVAWTVYEMSKLFDTNLGYTKPVSNRKARIADPTTLSHNPHIADADADRGKKRAEGGKLIKRPLNDPHRRRDIGKTRNTCRLVYGMPECFLPQHLREIVFDIGRAVNNQGQPLFRASDMKAYEALKAAGGSTQAQLERAMPQHHPNGSAFSDWLQARAVDPQNAACRPINSSDLPVIFKGKTGGKTATVADMDILLRYHQRRGDRQAHSPLTLQIMEHGSRNEVHGVATALRFLLDGTNNWSEQVGLLRLPGELSYVSCSPDVVLHLQTARDVIQVPLEIKCPTSMFGNKFSGKMKIEHLLQIHIQMRALQAEYGYLCYWTREAGHLYKIIFDDQLWELIKDGITAWRQAVEGGAQKSPQLNEDKTRCKQVWDRCDKIYDEILKRSDYSILPSCVVKAGS